MASEPLAGALAKRLRSSPRSSSAMVPSWLLEQSELGGAEARAGFSFIAQRLEARPPQLLRRTTVAVLAMVQFDAPWRWNALLERTRRVGGLGVPREVVFARLILSFPEVRWIFWTDSQPNGDHESVTTWHGVSPGSVPAIQTGVRKSGDSGIAHEFPALFDPGGLQAQLRAVALGQLEGDHDGSSSHWLTSHRNKIAACVDEEESYAYFGSYLCYRYGYRVWPVTHWSQMQELFDDRDRGRAAAAPNSSPRVSLTFEDLYLSFSDRAPRDDDGKARHLSDLEERDALCGALKVVPKRVIVTSGHHRGPANRKIWRSNRKYTRSSPTEFRVLYKPLGGLFEMARRARLRRPRSVVASAVGEDFGPNLADGPSASGNHSVEGHLLAIAERLIERSRSLLASEPKIQDAIHAATLALDASELLGARTPTSALEALSLQHEAEIVAESLFIGVDQNLELKQRFEEINDRVKEICRWFHPGTRRRSELNARLAIIERLGRRCSELHQLEEELECLAEARRLRFRFWARQRWWRRPLAPILSYFGYCLTSLPRFILVVVAWAAFFGISYYVFALFVRGRPDDFWNAMAGASKLFFTGEPATNWTNLGNGASPGLETAWDLWLTFQGIMSFTNLGLLVSHLYLIISRR